MISIRLAALCLATVLLVAETASAALIIDAGPASIQQQFSGGNYVAGTEFTATSSLTVYALGWLDVEGDGLLSSHTVGLWSASTQDLLASATVTSSSSTVLSAQGTAVWYLGSIGAPLVIGPGTYRVAGTVGADLHSALSGDKIGNGVTLSSGYVRTAFPNGGFAYPDQTFGSEAIRATVSTDPVGAPEPASMLLLGTGLLGLGMRRWNGRRC